MVWTKFWFNLTADKVPDVRLRGLPFLRIVQVKKRADERTRTA